eukprot:scaffold897_cov402-Prasinococcus_capsulatus_cf.AAC.60
MWKLGGRGEQERYQNSPELFAWLGRGVGPWTPMKFQGTRRSGSVARAVGTCRRRRMGGSPYMRERVPGA